MVVSALHLRENNAKGLLWQRVWRQRPIFLPELDLVIVLTGWNILPGQPFFHAMEAIERVTAAITE